MNWLSDQSSPGVKRQFLEATLVCLVALESTGFLHDLGANNLAIREVVDLPSFYDLGSWCQGKPFSLFGHWQLYKDYAPFELPRSSGAVGPKQVSPGVGGKKCAPP